uniref:Uncharacterized protein n=1 Tax=Rhizophora mucronata TaxID=61149 RepID=A0A2P2PJ19_RHIMU
MDGCPQEKLVFYAPFYLLIIRFSGELRNSN